jgi:hypothetical protein
MHFGFLVHQIYRELAEQKREKDERAKSNMPRDRLVISIYYTYTCIYLLYHTHVYYIHVPHVYA